MPAQTDSNEKYGHLGLKQLREKAIRIEELDAAIANLEKETSISFSEEPHSEAEIATFSPIWMRRIEGMGIEPREVYLYTNGQCRFYEVPKSRLKPPLSLPKRSAKQRALDQKRSEELRGVRPGTRY